MKTLKEAIEFIEQSNGKIFSVKFIPRRGPSKDLRHMRCRTGVTKHLAGGERAYNPKDYDLINVFDLDANGYRCFPLDGLKEIMIKGEWHEVTRS